MTKTAKDFNELLDTYSKVWPLKQGDVISLYMGLKCNVVVTDHVISNILKDYQIPDTYRSILLKEIGRVSRKFKGFKYNYSYHWEKICVFLQQPLGVPPMSFPLKETVPCSTSSKSKCNQCHILQKSLGKCVKKNNILKKVLREGGYGDKVLLKKKLKRQGYCQ